jgi:putative ABC transport system permease protein
MPDWKKELRQRVAGLRLAPAREVEIVEELSQHLDDRYEELLLSGVSEEEAHRALIAELSDGSLLSQELRKAELPVERNLPVFGETRRLGWVMDLWQDLQYGLRAHLKKPSFSLLAVLTLALGIGANSTIFSFVNGILIRPLPFKAPDALVMLDETAPKRNIDSMGVSFPNFVDWRQRNHVFEDVAAYDDRSFTLTDGGEPEQLAGGRLSQGLLEILGVAPMLGRTFASAEDSPGGNPVVILGHGLWQRRFSGDPNIIGKTVMINSASRTVIGVMPAGFRFPEVADLWVPLALDDKVWTRTDRGLSAIARLKPGVTIEQARPEMAAVAGQIEQENPVTNEGMSVSVTEVRQALVGDYRRALLILLGGVCLVLLIACANIANLLLARASSRHREMAIRAAIGASRGRIVRQLITESLVLSAVGGAAGLLLAMWGLHLLLAAIPIEFPYWMKFSLDGRVVGFTVAVSLLTGIIFGTAPALAASKVDLNDALKEGGRSGVDGARGGRLRSLLVVAEVALSLVLLVGAGLMMRSFIRLQNADSGLNAKNVLTMVVPLPSAKYKTPEQRSDFFQHLLERIQALPGVESAGAVSRLPLSGSAWGRSLTVEGRPVLPVGQAVMINHFVVTPDYRKTMGITLLRGRDFTNVDSKDAPKVTMIDQRLAEEYWPDEDPIGKRVRFGPPEDNEPWHTIVGVVGEVRHQRLDRATRKSVYLPALQVPLGEMAITVRTRTDPESMTAAVRNQVRDLDPQQPVMSVNTMTDVIAKSIWQQRLYAILFGVFAVMALILASIGIYGVISYVVTQRTHEIGIRLALGAQAGDVLRLVVRQGMTLTIIGLVIGLAASFALTRLMASLLFSVSATDPMTFVAISALLAFVAFLACYIPARRATKVDPMIALRYE